MTILHNINPTRLDPTRMVTIRRKFRTENNKRIGLIKSGVVTYLESDEIEKRWLYLTDGEKIKEIEALVSRLKQQAIGNEKHPWWEDLLGKVYISGLGRTFDDVMKLPFDTVRDLRKQDFINRMVKKPPTMFHRTLNRSRNQFFPREPITNYYHIRLTVNVPQRDVWGQFMSDKASKLSEQLAKGWKREVDGISQAIARATVKGIDDGKSAKQISKDIRELSTDIPKYAADRIAETEITRANAEAQLDAFEALGIDEVTGIVEVEIDTMEDALVCEECLALVGEPLTIEEARGVIPIHPWCRCAWKLSEPEEDYVTQNRLVQMITRNELRIVTKGMILLHKRLNNVERFILHGGSGSGNFGHSGRPGEVGGSSSSGGGKTQLATKEQIDAMKPKALRELAEKVGYTSHAGKSPAALRTRLQTMLEMGQLHAKSNTPETPSTSVPKITTTVPSEPTQKVTTDHKDTVLAAFKHLDKDKVNSVSIADIKQHTGLSTSDVHKAINDMRRSGMLTGSQFEGYGYSEGERDRILKDSIREYDQSISHVHLRNSREYLHELASSGIKACINSSKTLSNEAKQGYQEFYYNTLNLLDDIGLKRFIDNVKGIRIIGENNFEILSPANITTNAETETVVINWESRVIVINGGSGSGNFGHSGRPGEVGGSGDSTGGKLERGKAKTLVGEKEHAHADMVSNRFAKALGGKTEEQTTTPGQKDKKPYDVQVPKASGTGNHDIEVKSLLKGEKQGISVHADALLRKVEHAAQNPNNTFHTVVSDERKTYENGEHKDKYSGHQYYYKRGSGKYNLSQMHKVSSMEELKELLDKPDDQLPEKAKGSLPSDKKTIDKLKADAKKASEGRKDRDTDRKQRMKEVLKAQARAQNAKKMLTKLETQIKQTKDKDEKTKLEKKLKDVSDTLKSHLKAVEEEKKKVGVS